MGNPQHDHERTMPVLDLAELEAGERVRVLRLARGWTQTNLADRAREHLVRPITISRRIIGGIEAGPDKDPDYAWPGGVYTTTVHMVAIAHALGVPPEFLDDALVPENDELAQGRRLFGGIERASTDPFLVIRDKPCSPTPAGRGATGHWW